MASLSREAEVSFCDSCDRETRLDFFDFEGNSRLSKTCAPCHTPRMPPFGPLRFRSKTAAQMMLVDVNLSCEVIFSTSHLVVPSPVQWSQRAHKTKHQPFHKRLSWMCCFAKWSNTRVPLNWSMTMGHTMTCPSFSVIGIHIYIYIYIYNYIYYLISHCTVWYNVPRKKILSLNHRSIVRCSNMVKWSSCIQL